MTSAWLAVITFLLISLAGCASTDDVRGTEDADPAPNSGSAAAEPSTQEIIAGFIARMDSLPPDERLPNWEQTRAMMLREAPKVGDPAPDFELETREGGETIRLSQYDRPVVLIFGSWT